MSLSRAKGEDCSTTDRFESLSNFISGRPKVPLTETQNKFKCIFNVFNVFVQVDIVRVNAFVGLFLKCVLVGLIYCL